MREVLDAATPDIPILGEEGGGERGVALGWLVDPLDGTANFLHGLEAVGVSIGLVEDGVPIVGVVHAPLFGRTYSARLGGGAFRDDQPIRVSERAPAQAICATGFPFRRKHLIESYLAVFAAAMHSLEDLRRIGGASLDLSWTADGVFDGYFELSLGPVGRRRGRAPRPGGGRSGHRLGGRRPSVVGQWERGRRLAGSRVLLERIANIRWPASIKSGKDRPGGPACRSKTTHFTASVPDRPGRKASPRYCEASIAPSGCPCRFTRSGNGLPGVRHGYR